MKYLTKDEVQRLIVSIDNKRDLLLVQLGLVIGCRVSEIVTIDIKNIEPDRIKIWDEKKNVFRDVVIDSATREMLNRYLEDGWEPKPHVKHRLFYFSTKTANRILKRYCEKAGIPKEKAHWHTLRHTHIMDCLDSNVPINYIVEQTGDSPTTIINIYGRPSIDARLRMIEHYRNGEQKRTVLTEKEQ
jgi:integrase